MCRAHIINRLKATADCLCGVAVRVVRDVLWFLWGTNWIYICYVEESRPSLWYSGQSTWLQIQRSGFDSQRYQISWEVVGLERGPLSVVSTIEKLLERKSSGSGLESREYGCRDPSRWPRDTLYPQKLALTSPASGGRSVGIVRSGLRPLSFTVRERLADTHNWRYGSDFGTWKLQKYCVPFRILDNRHNLYSSGYKQRTVVHLAYVKPTNVSTAGIVTQTRACTRMQTHSRVRIIICALPNE
jgi:hypothetical protein